MDRTMFCFQCEQTNLISKQNKLYSKHLSIDSNHKCI